MSVIYIFNLTTYHTINIQETSCICDAVSRFPLVLNQGERTLET